MIEQLYVRAKKFIERDPVTNGFRRGDLDELLNLSGAILSKSVCRGCPEEQIKLFIELREFINNLTQNNIPMDQTKTGSFVLPENVVLYDMEKGKAFTNLNLTDDEALDLLSRNPRSIKQFSKVPNDWESQVKAYAKKEKPSLREELKKTATNDTTDAGKAKTEKTVKPPKPAKPEKPGTKVKEVIQADDDKTDAGNDDDDE